MELLEKPSPISGPWAARREVCLVTSDARANCFEFHAWSFTFGWTLPAGMLGPEAGAGSVLGAVCPARPSPTAQRWHWGRVTLGSPRSLYKIT